MKNKMPLKRVPIIIGKHALLFSFLAFFIATVLGLFIFYQNKIFPKKEETSEAQIILKKSTYTEIMRMQKEQEEKFKSADGKEYKNPF